jgi:metal-dependent hydrolase (beta-lactamase superfamily II)
MFDIEESVPTEEIYDGEWEKSLVEQLKKREDSEISECESDDEGDDVEMDNMSLPLDEPHGSAVPTECHHPGHFLLHCVFQ